MGRDPQVVPRQVLEASVLGPRLVNRKLVDRSETMSTTIGGPGASVSSDRSSPLGEQTGTSSKRQRWMYRVALFFLGVALYGPWLRPGYLLGYDWPSGPRNRVSPAIYGLGQGRAPVAPLTELIRGLHHISFGVDPIAVLLLLSPLILGLGMELIFPDRPLAWFAGALVLSVNPFVEQRLSVGSFGVVLAQNVFPFLVATARKSASGQIRASVATALVLAIGVAIYPQVLLPAAVLTVTIILAERWRNARRTPLTRAAGGWFVGIVVLAASSAYWVAPTLLTGVPAYQRIGSDDLRAFASQSDPHLGLFGNLLGLYGFWRPGIRSTKNVIGDWWLFLAAILLVVGYGTVMLLRRSDRRLVTPIAVSGLVGLALAAGAKGPTGGGFTFLYNNVPGFRSYREPEKALWLLEVAYAVFFGWGVVMLVHKLVTRLARLVFGAVLLGLPVVYGVAQFWGLNNGIAPAHYPASWYQAEKIIAASPGRILFFPWHAFQVYPFAGYRTIADPAPTFFSSDVLVSADSEMPNLGDDSTDPREGWVQHVEQVGMSNRRVGELLVPLGVRWVLLYHTTTWRSYDWLFHQDDVVLVRHWGDTDLFENVDWRGEAYETLPDGGTVKLAEKEASPTSIRLRGSVVPDSTLTLTEAYDPGWRISGYVPERNHAGTNDFTLTEPKSSAELTFGPSALLLYMVVLSGIVFTVASALAAFRPLVVRTRRRSSLEA